MQVRYEVLGKLLRERGMLKQVRCKYQPLTLVTLISLLAPVTLCSGGLPLSALIQPGLGCRMHEGCSNMQCHIGITPACRWRCRWC